MTLPGKEVHQLYMIRTPQVYMREDTAHGQVRLSPACFYAVLLTYVACLPWPLQDLGCGGSLHAKIPWASDALCHVIGQLDFTRCGRICDHS
jgi:hypothetical protein